MTERVGSLLSVDSGRFRHVLGHFATGVAVITADTLSGPVGMAVSSFTSVSLEPPLVAFLPDKSSTSWPKIRDAGTFCVNILSSDQKELCARFARKGTDKFAGIGWHPAPSGAPVLDGVMAWIDCELTQTFESGDHYIAIGQVLQLEAAEYGAPLVFFQGGYGNFATPGESVTAARDLGAQRLDDLARMTGMSARDLQRYETSAEGVVNELVGGYVHAFRDACTEISRRAIPAREALSELLHAAFDLMEANRVPIMILQNERQYLATRPEFDYLEPLERHIDEIWLGALQRGVDEGDFSPNLNVRIARRLISDMLFTAARRYNPGGSGRPGPEMAEVAETSRELILHGLLR